MVDRYKRYVLWIFFMEVRWSGRFYRFGEWLLLMYIISKLEGYMLCFLSWSIAYSGALCGCYIWRPSFFLFEDDFKRVVVIGSEFQGYQLSFMSTIILSKIDNTIWSTIKIDEESLIKNNVKARDRDLISFWGPGLFVIYFWYQIKLM